MTWKRLYEHLRSGCALRIISMSWMAYGRLGGEDDVRKARSDSMTTNVIHRPLPLEAGQHALLSFFHLLADA